MSDSGRCACSRNDPKAVDLQWLISPCNDGDVVSIEMVVTPEDIAETSSTNRMFGNLERCGWSPIRLRWNDKEPSNIVESCSFTPTNGSIVEISRDAWFLLSQYPKWKEMHAELFDADLIADYHNGNVEKSVRFIPFESGASGSSVAEAKQSWEYSRSTGRSHDASHLVHRRLRGWTELLHTLICHVMLELKLPTTHLVTPHSSTIEEADGGNAPLDLLRAFRYEPMPSEETNMRQQESSNPTQIGSSSHTDWGSWTVVWQDDTDPPCLQTFCPECQQWNCVPSPPSFSLCTAVHDNAQGVVNEAYFIIHVGDLTSLCLRQAMNDLSTSSPKCDVEPFSPDMWPSPRHRVLSPIHYQYRYSLVYFVYPQAALTPATISDSLLDWCCQRYLGRIEGIVGDEMILNKETSPMNVDWKHYSILADQSSSSIERDPMVYPRRWYDMQRISVGNILHEKWRQVQR